MAKLAWICTMAKKRDYARNNGSPDYWKTVTGTLHHVMPFD